MAKEFFRKIKEDKPVIAICYDFDKTLSPDDMQAQGYIQSVGYEVSKFWERSNGLAEDNEMDQNLAYMLTMKETSYGKFIFNRKALNDYGSKVKLFPGVETWFKRIKQYGLENGVLIEHYIISSGLKEMIEGTCVAEDFEKIYASSFYYDEAGVAQWPAQVVNFTSKTQYLFRIEKGTLDVNDPGVNEYFEPSNIRVPFRNMIYIGDSDTDIPCMKLINSNGGHSIGVYNPESQNKSKVYKMMHDKRIKYFVAADYSENSELDTLVKSIIHRTISNEVLENIHYKNEKEFLKYDASISDEEKEKRNLIIQLENSGSFSNTHNVISKLLVYERFTPTQKDWLIEIANKNSQVYSIITDSDLKRFYQKILDDMAQKNQEAINIQNLILGI